MSKKNLTIIIILVIAAIGGAIAWHYYSESQKSGWVKGAERVENVFTGK